MSKKTFTYELLERRTAGQSLTLTFQLLRYHWKLLLGGSILVTLPFYLFAYYQVARTTGVLGFPGGFAQTGNSGFLGIALVSVLVFMLAFSIHICFLNQFLMERTRSAKEPTLSVLLKLSLKRLVWYLLGTFIWFLTFIVLYFALMVIFLVAGLLIGLTVSSQSFLIGFLGVFLGIFLMITGVGYISIVALQFFIAGDLRKSNIFVGIGKAFEMAHSSGWNFKQTLMAGFIGVLTYLCLSLSPLSVFAFFGGALGWFSAGWNDLEELTELVSTTNLISNVFYPLLTTPILLFAGVFHLGLTEKSEGIRTKERIESLGQHLMGSDSTPKTAEE